MDRIINYIGNILTFYNDYRFILLLLVFVKNVLNMIYINLAY